MFFSKFFISEMWIEYKPQEIPVDDEEKMKRKNRHLIDEICPSKKSNIDYMVQKKYHQK